MKRRDFLKNIGVAGLATFLASSPWISALSESEHTQKEKIRLAIIGAGSRARHLSRFLTQNPKVEIAVLCDIYQPSIDSTLKLVPGAKVCMDYRIK